MFVSSTSRVSFDARRFILRNRIFVPFFYLKMLRNFRSDACGNYGTATAPAVATTQSECYYTPIEQRYPINDFQYSASVTYGNNNNCDITRNTITNIYENSDCRRFVSYHESTKNSNDDDHRNRIYSSQSVSSPILRTSKYELLENIAADYNANIELLSSRNDPISLNTSRCDRESDTVVVADTTTAASTAAALTTYPWMKKISFSDDGKRKRQSYTRKQTLELEKEFCYSQYLTKKRRGELCHLLQLSEKQIKTWFQNRRMKKKKETADRKNDFQTFNSGTIVVGGGSVGIDNESSLSMIDTAKSIRGIDMAAAISSTNKSTDYWRSNDGIGGAASVSVPPPSPSPVADNRICAARSHPATIKESSPHQQSHQHRPSSNIPAQFIENSSQFYFNNSMRYEL